MAGRHSITHALLLTSLLWGCSGSPNASTEDEPLAFAADALSDDVVAATELLTVNVPRRFNVPYAGAAAAEFPEGLPLSIGSGLRLKPRAGRRCDCGSPSRFSLLGLSDRGPNGDAPDYIDAQGVKHPSKSYLVPKFAPQLVSIEVSPRQGARVTHHVALRDGRQKAVGLPSTLTTEVGVSDTLVAFAPSAAGVDPEGLDFDADGDVWLGDEYGPSLLKVDRQSGEILTRLLPGSGLPALLASRQVNRGFEGVAVTPGGKVYAMVQSTLDVSGKSKGSATFIRILELDPSTGQSRMFGYPHDVAAYKKSGDAKIGDLIALDDTHFLTIEQGKDKDGNLRNLVYQFDISSATDLSGVTLNSGANSGKDLEFGTLAEVTAQVTLASKTLVVDLRAYGWTPEKAEGMTLLDDRTLIVANDQDFGATAVIEGDANGTDPTKYTVDGSGTLSFNGAPSTGSYAIHALPPEEQRSNLFVIHLQQPFSGYCRR